MSFFIRKLYQLGIISGLFFLTNLTYTVFGSEAIDRYIIPKPIGNGAIGNFASNPVSTLSSSRCSLEYMDGGSIEYTGGTCFGAQDCFNRNIKLKTTNSDTGGYRAYCVGLGQEQESGVIYSPGIIMVCKHPEWNKNNSLELDYYNTNKRNVGGEQKKEFDVYDEVNRLNNGEGITYCNTVGFVEEADTLVTRQVKVTRTLIQEITEAVGQVTNNANRTLASLVSNIRGFWSF